EANPLRANLVRDAADYRWSSYAVHGRGEANPLVAELPAWSSLGRTERARQTYWQHFVHRPQDEFELATIRQSLTNGRPFGSPAWTTQTASALGLRLSNRPRGGPRKGSNKLI